MLITTAVRTIIPSTPLLTKKILNYCPEPLLQILKVPVSIPAHRITIPSLYAFSCF
jgi:hypothetical protein